MMELKDFDKARNVARMVHLACLRDGVRETMDYWCATTMMEAACIMGASKEEIETTTKSFFSLKIEKWQLESTVQSLERVSANLAVHQQDNNVFNFAIDRLKEVIEQQSSGAFNAAAKSPEEETITSAFHRASFNYRGLASNFTGANFIPGNFKYAGQLPDHCLTRSDWQQFGKVLTTPLARLIGAEEAKKYPAVLKDIHDPAEFLRVADKIIRNSFGTDATNLEDMASQGHAKYDKIVDALLKLSGIGNKKESDSRTNISVSMGLGLGDCRHHAQAKQILFDAWQKEHMNSALKDAYESLARNDLKRYRLSIEEFKDIESVELRTMDAVVQSSVQMSEKYSPKLNGKNQMLVELGGKINDIEDHTLTFLLSHDKRGNLESVKFADSFYQNHYKWGDGEIQIDQIKIDENRKVVIPAKTIEAVDPVTGQEVHQLVQLRPTPYTGKRDEVAKDEHGKLLLLGIPVEKEFNLAEKLTESYRQRRVPLDALHAWHVKNGIVLDGARKKQAQRHETKP